MEANEESSSYCRPLATLPWVPVQTSDLKLENSAAFKNAEFEYVNKKNPKQSQENGFRNFNRLFPFYIPKQFHTMSAAEMQETWPDGKYWAVACHFLLSNKAHGNFLWQNFQINVRHGYNAFCFQPHISLSNMAKMFPDSIPQCQNPKDFLFEPWVLIQLPFQPVLLHQWLVAVFAEALKFETEMTEFYYFKYPESLEPALEELNTILEMVKFSLGKGFDWLQMQTKDSKEIVVDKLKSINKILSDALSFLEFWFKLDGLKVVKSLKKLCWENFQPEGKGLAAAKMRPLTCFDERNFVYNIRFWRHVSGSHEMFGCSGQYYVKDFGLYSKLMDKGPVSSASVNHDKFKSVLKQHFADSTENRLAPYFDDLEKDSVLTKLVDDLANCENVKSLLRIEEKDHGILGTILHLVSEVKLADALNSLCCCLCENSKQSPATLLKRTFNDTDDFDLNHIKSTLKKVKSIQESGQWSMQSIIKGVKNEVCKMKALKGCPSFSDDPYIIAAIFQARIKKVVCQAIGVHHDIKNFKEEKDGILREWHIGQYLLPCFVASFLDLCADPSAAKSFKKWYMQFIHELISTFETGGFSKSSKKQVMKSVDENFALFLSFQHDASFMLLRYFKKISRAFAAEIQGDNAVTRHFQKFGLFDVLYEVLLGVDNSLDEDMCKCSLYSCINWDFQMWDFFKRVELALSRCASKRSILAAPLSREERREDMTELIRQICTLFIYNDDHQFKAPKYADSLSLLCAIFDYCKELKLEVVSLHRLKRLKPNMKNAEDEIKEEAKQLTEQQILSIAFYLTMKFATEERDEFFEEGKVPKPSSGSPLEIAFHSYVSTDRWPFKKFVADYFGADAKVTFDFAREKAPLSYVIAINEISRKKKVKIETPGEYWYFPIKHCRWCGSLDSPEFRVCPECRIEPDYPDVNLFCSALCEQSALDKHHTEEHVQFLLHQIEENGKHK